MGDRCVEVTLGSWGFGPEEISLCWCGTVGTGKRDRLKRHF